MKVLPQERERGRAFSWLPNRHHPHSSTLLVRGVVAGFCRGGSENIKN